MKDAKWSVFGSFVSWDCPTCCTKCPSGVFAGHLVGVRVRLVETGVKFGVMYDCIVDDTIACAQKMTPALGI